MFPFPHHRYARFTALPLLGALAASAIIVLPATTAAAADPPPPTTTGPKLVDLGALDVAGQGSGRTGGINNKGQVAAGVWIGNGPRATVLSGGSRTDVQADLPAGATGGEALDVNDSGTVVGRVSGVGKEFQSFTWSAGKAELIEPTLARSINAKGQTAGDAWVRDPNGEVTRLQAFTDQYTEIGGINAAGAVAGVADMDPAVGASTLRGFVTRPGMPIDVKDALPFNGGRTLAKDVNDKGQAAGWATTSTGGYVPVVWNGATPVEQRTPFGGSAVSINNAGTAVGTMKTSTGADHAAMFQDGSATDLNDLRPPGNDWTLVQATGVNDNGQIAGIGRPAGSSVNHAFLMDFSTQGLAVTSLLLETQRYPSTEWERVDGDGTTDGNRVRVTVSVVNRGDYHAFTQLQVAESAEGRALPGGTFDEILAPKETVTERFEFDTAGLAWADGEARSARGVTAKLVSGGVLKDGRTEQLLVRPKPAILVHGYKSDAASSWGKYQPILTAGHPLLKGYAVGDGQFPGVLNTGSLSRPFFRTNTIEENAEQEALYIEGVRRATGAFHVDVIAHSMGGLMTRQYLQHDMPASLDAKPVVNRMIQMGTPNQGSPCADLVLDLFGGPGYAPGANDFGMPLMPATLQLSRPYVQRTFNSQVTDLKGVTVSNLVGVGWGVPCYSLPDGDLVVPEKSARYIYTDVPYTRTNHLEMTENPADFAAYVKPRLASLLASTSNPTGTPAAKTLAAPALETDAATTFAYPSGRVEAGATASYPLDVPAGSAFGVTGVLPPTVGLALKNPSGSVATGYAAGSAQAGAEIQGLNVTAPTAGRWTLVVTNTGPTPVEAPMVAWVTGSPVTIQATATPDDTGRIAVSATLRRDGAPLTGGTVVAKLASAGTPTDLPLADDGAHGDGAAGDGVFGGTSAARPDGDYAVVVRADTAADGMRVTRTAVRVQRPDTREFALTLTPQPGGTVAASPQQPAYRVGTQVTLTATPEAGKLPLGWTVDGAARPAGALTLTMDRDHTVVARFGRYSVTELGALPGGDPASTIATGLNDRGQVSAMSSTGVGDARRKRAVRWENGALTDLGGLPCTETAGMRCEATAYGINQAGEVAGASTVRSQDTMFEHATVWSKGVAKDLQAGAPWGVTGSARDLNDNGQVYGDTNTKDYDYRHVLWTGGTAKRFPDTPKFFARNTFTGAEGGRINGRGDVAGAYVTDDGVAAPIAWMPALTAGGVTGRLPAPACWKATGSAADVDPRGDAVGTISCNNDGEPLTQHAYLWKDGDRIDLGVGSATAMNGNGMITGTTGFGTAAVPAVWLDRKAYRLQDLLSGPQCATGGGTCFTVQSLVDVNSSGQLLARGMVRDLGADGRLQDQARSFLLTPTTAEADLRVVHQVSSAQPAPGGTLTWTTTVSNAGPQAATGVRADVTVPAQVTVSGCETTRGSCTALGTNRRVSISALPAGATAVITVTAKLPVDLAENTTLVSSAGVSSLAVSDPVPGNDAASTTSTVKKVLDRKEISWADPVRIGRSSYGSEVVLTNRQPTPMRLTQIETTGAFRQTNVCPVDLAAGATCTVTVFFTPSELGAVKGELRFFTEEAPAPAFTVALSGTGIEANHEPVIGGPEDTVEGTVGRPLALEVPFTDEDLTDTHTAQISWGGMETVDAQVVQRQGGGTVRLSRTFTEPGDGVVLVWVTDSKGDRVMKVLWYDITEKVVNAAPVIAPGPNANLTAGERFTRTVTFADPTSTSWTADVDYGDGTVVPLTPKDQELALDHVWKAAGSYPVKVTVKDDGGLSASAGFVGTVVRAQTPNTAPKVTFDGAASLTEGGTWTASGALVDPDADRWSAVVDFGDGTGPQPVKLTGKAFTLTHVFADNGSRTVEVRVTDDMGGTGLATKPLAVANAAPAVTLNGPATGTVTAIGAPVQLSAGYTDAGVEDTHTATWTIGGRPFAGAVAGVAGKGTVTRPHVFTKAGRYPVSVSVKDDDGGVGTAARIGAAEAYVLVYDPATAIVGAGLTASPATSCTLTAACAKASTATFLLAASYGRKATIPTGDLRYTATGFDLRASSFGVLAAADGQALLRGTGKVNGTTDVTFEITAADSGKPFDRTDNLRVTVTDRSGKVVYDNQRDGRRSPVTGVVRICD